MVPKRSEGPTIYEFDLTSAGERSAIAHDILEAERVNARPYYIHWVQFRVGSRSKIHGVDVDVQGKIIDRHSMKDAFQELKLIGARRCFHAEHSTTNLRSERPYGQAWQYGCDFSFHMTSMKIEWGKRARKEQDVLRAYQELALELGFSNVKPTLEVYHTFLHLINHTWTYEGYQIVEDLWKPAT